MFINRHFVLAFTFFGLIFSGIDVSSQHVSKGPYAKGEKHVSFNNEYRIVTGERPPVDIESISSDAYQTGNILVKLSDELLVNDIDVSCLEVKEGYVKVNNDKLDELNKRYGVTQFKSILYELYQVDEKSLSNREKHKAWGFHKWYELKLSSKVDIKEAVKAYSSTDEVEVAEPVYKIMLIDAIDNNLDASNNEKLNSSTNDPLFHDQWSFKNTGQVINSTFGTEGIDISIEDAWDLQTGNDQVIVSIHDSGIQHDHPDVEGNMWYKIGPDGTATKPGSHGTHVAGTVAAITNNEIGVAGIAGGSGTGDGIRLMSVEVPFGDPTTLNTRQGFIYAADNGSAVSQNSWAYIDPNVYNSSDLLGIDYFNAEAGGDALVGGGLVIFAAGNSNDDSQWYPGFYSGTMAVASHDNRGYRSSFSNYGTWIDITAPGSGILSIDINNGYNFKSGTSMACPHVSGVAALIISHAYGELTPEDVWNSLVENTDDIYELNPDYLNLLGSGRLNAYKPLNRLFDYSITIKLVNSNLDPIDGVPVIMGDETMYTSTEGEVFFRRNNGDFKYSIDVSGYHKTGGMATVFEDDLSINQILLSDNVILPNFYGRDEVCINSEIIYNVDGIESGTWNVYGGNVIDSSADYVSVEWLSDDDVGNIWYIVALDDDYQVAYQKDIHVKSDIAQDQPRIILKGEIPLLICTTPDAEPYTWFYEGTILSYDNQYFRADNQSYNGKFWVEIITENQCPNTSKPVEIITNATFKDGEISVFPNPSSGNFTIRHQSIRTGNGLLTIVDSFGKVRYKEKITKSQQVLIKELNSLPLPEGVYLVYIQIDNNEPITQRLIISH